MLKHSKRVRSVGVRERSFCTLIPFCNTFISSSSRRQIMIHHSCHSGLVFLHVLGFRKIHEHTWQSLPAVIITHTWAGPLCLAVNKLCLHPQRGPGVSDRPPQCEVAAGASSPSLIGCTWGGRARCNCDKRGKKKLCLAGFSALIYNLQIDYSFSASRANCSTLSPRLENVLNTEYVLTTNFQLSSAI